jgi:hypothetical protein
LEDLEKKIGGILSGHLEYITSPWYFYGNLVIYWECGIFTHVLVYYIKKNLATP